MKVEKSILFLISSVAATTSPKRGLIHIPNSNWPQDNSIWFGPGSDLTWYYNYGQEPSTQYTSIPQSQIEFVPQKWGQSSNPLDTSFSTYVTQLIANGRAIKNVLAYNEPNYPYDWGGAQLDPSTAAIGWIADFIPLQLRGVRIGLPAVNGDSGGLQWLDQFLGNCTQKLQRSSCPYDFLPIHYYNDFSGLQSLLNQVNSMFSPSHIWLTEFADPNVDLATTQEFYKQAIPYLDGLSNVERYSWFGAFRSNVSNVGANPTFLNNAGKLTDIGSWYLGGGATGVLPTSS
ncbi:glycoside hydrolase family 128 protein [Xylariaceae sp. FL1651]|nr:glycoside hydrolase family 128 protein [Xylariaceae sp. FL1651]